MKDGEEYSAEAQIGVLISRNVGRPLLEEIVSRFLSLA